jgi:phage baseplate assembly protein V
MVKIGVISAVDHDAKKIRVEAGGMNSAWLPWPVEMGRNFRRWRPLREGQQVVMVAPSGELAQAAVIGMLYSSSLDAPETSPDLDLVLFDDGTSVSYDSANHHMEINCVGSVTIKGATDLLVDFGGSITVNAGSDITVNAPATTVNTTQTHNGDVTINGNLNVSELTTTGGLVSKGTAGGGGASITGNVRVTSGDVNADGVSLKQHIHPGDSGGTTGPAQ